MNTATKEKTREEEFIESLEELLTKNDRRALAALRRGLGKKPGEEMGVWRYIARYTNGLKPYQEDAYYIVATLFGFYSAPSWRSDDDDKNKTNLGASLKLLQARMGGDGAERRFVALLNTHRDEMPEHLRQIVSLLKSKDMPIDWVQLLQAVEYWDFDDEHRRQRNWAKAFWQE